MRQIKAALATIILVLISACAARPDATPRRAFDGQHAFDVYLKAQMDLGPRPVGTAADRATGDYVIAQLNESHWNVVTQEFTFRRVPIRNVIGKVAEGRGPVIILGAHYDTRRFADQDSAHPHEPVPGANDGASGVAVLLELARTLDVRQVHNEIWLAFFDAEDDGELNMCDPPAESMEPTPPACDPSPWPWSVGATYVADHLDSPPFGVIVVDMIGDKDQNIYYERNSDAGLQQELWSIADQMGYSTQFIPEYKWSMEDDHTPFLNHKIRAVDMIDFDYPYWHTTQDTTDKVSAASLGRVGAVLQTWLEGKSR